MDVLFTMTVYFLKKSIDVFLKNTSVKPYINAISSSLYSLDLSGDYCKIILANQIIITGDYVSNSNEVYMEMDFFLIKVRKSGRN